MNFVYPEFLWGFLLLSIPIVIHLFNFKRYKTLYFSSLKFVKHIDQQTKSTQRLKHLLILASRLLAFSFLVLAFAQPYFGEKKNANSVDGSVIMIYVDNSYSMQAKGSNGELLSNAQESVRDMIRKSPINARFIIGTNEMSGIEERILNKSQALKKIDEITYHPVPRDAIDILKWQTNLLNRENDKITASSYIYYSDFQINGQTFNKAGKIKFPDVPIVPVKLKPEANKNIYIDSVWFTSPIHKSKKNCEININVVNDTDEDIENLELNAIIGTVKRTIFINVLANGKTTTKFTYRDGENGWVQGYLTIADDELNFDDNYYLSYEVTGAKVLIIEGEDHIPNFSSVYALDDYYNTTNADINTITSDHVADKDLIVLNGLNKVSPGLIQMLNSHHANGGVLAFFPGINPDKSQWNNLLSAFDLPLLGDDISTGTALKDLAYQDEFFKGVFESESGTVRLPGVGRAFQTVGSKGYELIKMANGLPLWIRVKKKGQAFCFYAPVHPTVNEFTEDALFSTLLLRLGEISKRSQPISIEIGSGFSYPVYNLKDQNDVLHIVGNKLDLIPQHEVRNGVYYMSLDQNSSPAKVLAGNYEVKGKDGVVGWISLNFSRSESNLKYMSDDQLKILFGSANNLKINKIDADNMYDPNSIYKQTSYWRICIILTIIFVLAEMALIRLLK